MWREHEKIASEHAQLVRCRYLPKDSEPDLCPIKILATEFLEDGESAFDRLDLYRTRLQRETHTILRELRKLRKETGDDADEATDSSCSTGFQPVPEHAEQSEEVTTTEKATGKSEPTVSLNPLPQQ